LFIRKFADNRKKEKQGRVWRERKERKIPGPLENVMIPKYDIRCQDKYIKFKRIIKSAMTP